MAKTAADKKFFLDLARALSSELTDPAGHTHRVYDCSVPAIQFSVYPAVTLFVFNYGVHIQHGGRKGLQVGTTVEYERPDFLDAINRVINEAITAPVLDIDADK